MLMDMTIIDIMDVSRVASQRSSRADVGHVGLVSKLLRNTPTSPGLLTILGKTLIRHSRPLIFIATPTPYLRPTCHWLPQISSQFVWFTCSHFYCYDPLHFPFLVTPLIILTHDPTILCRSDIIIVYSDTIPLSLVLMLRNFIRTHSCLDHLHCCSLIYLHMLTSCSTQFSSYLLFLLLVDSFSHAPCVHCHFST